MNRSYVLTYNITDYEFYQTHDKAMLTDYVLNNSFKIRTGLGIESLFNKLRVVKDFSTLYVYNLGVFAPFLESYLIKLHYKYDDKLKAMCKDKPRTYNSFRNDLNQIYNMTISTESGYDFQILDISKIFPGDKIDLLTHYNLDDSCSLLDESIAYLDLLDKQFKIDKVKRQTRSSYAYAELKEFTVNKYKCKFEELFPKTTYDEREQLQHAYNGGLVYLNKKYKNKVIKNGLVIDKNSEFPYVMTNRDFPTGKGVRYEEWHDNAEYPLYIQKFEAKFKLKPNRIPTLPKNWNKRLKIIESDEDVDAIDVMTLCNVDFDHFIDNYDISYIKPLYGYMFKSINAPFKEFIEDKYQQKLEAQLNNDSFGRYYNKITMNSSYGKFAQYIVTTSRKSYVKADTTIVYKINKAESKLKSYFPMAIFIAAYGRDELLATADKHVSDIVYMDTDSIHFRKRINQSELDIGTNLGQWKIESEFDKAKYLREKIYVTETNNVLNIKAAGFTKSMKATIKSIKDFKYDFDYSGGMQTINVPGGIVYKPITKSIKEDD